MRHQVCVSRLMSPPSLSHLVPSVVPRASLDLTAMSRRLARMVPHSPVVARRVAALARSTAVVVLHLHAWTL